MKVRTSVLRGFALLALSSLTFAACDDKTTDISPLPVTVSVTPQTLNLQVGQSAPLVAIVQNAQNQNVTWTSANTAVATVDANGNVTAVTAGTAVITAASVENPSARAAAAVVVTPATQPNITLQLVPATASVQIGGTVQMVSVVGGTTNQAVTYESSAPGVATVNAQGLVTGVTAGTAVITARTAATPQAVATSVITVTATPPGGGITITIAPTQATAQIGGTQQFVATVSGAQNTAVMWRSESPSVATVNEQGLATAVAPGTAVITAMAAADTTRRVTATLTVVSGPAVTQPAISIQSVTTVGGVSLSPGAINVNQNVRVVVNVAAGSEALVQQVQIRLGGTTACQQQFMPPLAATQGVQVIECVIDIAQIDDQGAPLFPNAPYQLTAVAINPAGETVATASWGTLTLNQAALFQWTIATNPVTSAGPTIGADGLLWNEGDVVVTGRPILFDGGTVSQMTICLDLPAASNAATVARTAPAGAVDAVAAATNPCRVVTTATNNVFSVTFPKANTVTQTTAGGNGSANVSNSNVRPYASAGTVAQGTAFPSQNPAALPTTTPSIRVDNLAPTANIATLTAPVWFGANTTFGSTLPGAATADFIASSVADPMPGVGLPAAATRVTYHAVTREAYLASGTSAAARNNATVANAPAITNVNDLPENVSAIQYTLVASVVDRLGNHRNIFVTDFGVDRTAPTVEVDEMASEDDQTAFTGGPQTVITLDMVDDFSGFPAEPVLVRIDRRYFDNGTLVYECLRQGGNWTANTGTAATACGFVSRTDSNINLPDDDAHYIVQTRVRDRAGNLTPIITREYIIDGEDPDATVTGLNWSATTITLSGAFEDNVDLAWYDARARYDGNVGGLPNWLPLITPTEISSFGLPLVGETTVTRTLPFIRGFAAYTALNGEPTGATYNLTDVGFRVTDHAGNWDEDMMGFARNFDALTADLQRFNLTAVPSPSTAANNELCIDGDCAVGIANSLQFRAVAATVVGANTSPFSRVYFFAEFNGDAYLLGVDESAVLQTFGVASDPFPTARREWRYDVTLTGAQAAAVMQGIGDGDTFQIFAIGVDAQGDGAIASPFTVTARD